MLGWLTRKLAGDSAKDLFDSNFEKVKQRPLSEQAVIADIVSADIEKQALLFSGLKTLRQMSASQDSLIKTPANEMALFKRLHEERVDEQLKWLESMKEISRRENDVMSTMLESLLFALFTAVRSGNEETTEYILQSIRAWKKSMS